MIDIVIVTWNAEAMVSNCLQSIQSSNLLGEVIERVIVVDNASEIDLHPLVKSINPEFQFIQNKENLGFAKACNIGAGFSEAEFILFLNPDTQINRDSLIQVYTSIQNPSFDDIGIFGVPLKDDQGEATCGARFPSNATFLSNLLPKYIKSLPMAPSKSLIKASDLNGWGKIDQVIGAFFLVRKKVFAKLAGFDESFFVYFEEVDFAKRAALIGFSSYIINAEPIYHFGGGSSDTVRAMRLFYSLRSRFIYCNRYFSRRNFALLVFITCFLEFPARISKSLVTINVSDMVNTCYAYALVIQYFWRANTGRWL